MTARIPAAGTPAAGPGPVDVDAAIARWLAYRELLQAGWATSALLRAVEESADDVPDLAAEILRLRRALSAGRYHLTDAGLTVLDDEGRASDE